MDSSLEQEIARLSRPHDAENTEPVPPSSSSSSSLSIQASSSSSAAAASNPATVQPQNGAAATMRSQQQYQPQYQPQDESQHQEPSQPPPQPPQSAARLRRGSSGSSTASDSAFNRTGSAGRLAGGGGMRSPPKAAAVLAGRTMGDLHLPVTSEPQPYHQQQHTQGPRVGGGSGGLSATQGRPRPRLAANGERVAGAAPPAVVRPPVANGEKVAGFAGSKASAPISMGATASMPSMGAGASGVGKRSKEEEAWRRSEEALKQKEQSVRNALKEKQKTLMQESRLLATVDKELAQLALDHQTEVNELRKSLEVVDRELAFLDKDAQRKLEAFEKARTLLSGKVTQKQGITSRLTELIMASEKQRDAKLNEIMKKMTSDGDEAKAGGASYPN